MTCSIKIAPPTGNTTGSQKRNSTKTKTAISGINCRQQQASAQCRKRAQLPGEKRGERAEKNDQRQFHRQRRAADEPAGDDGIGDVPVFADEQRVALQRRRAAVGQIVSLRRRADDDELAAKLVAQIVGVAVQPAVVLQQQIFNRRAHQMRVVWRQPPVNVKIAVAVHGNNAFDTLCAAQNDFAARQIHLGVFQIELQFLRGEDDAHLPDALVGEGFGLAGQSWHRNRRGQNSFPRQSAL